MNIEDYYQSLSLKNGALLCYRDGKLTLLDILPLEILNRRLSYMSHNINYKGELITMTIGQNITFKDDGMITDCNKSKTIQMPMYLHHSTIPVNIEIPNEEQMIKDLSSSQEDITKDITQMVAVTIPIIAEDNLSYHDEQNINVNKTNEKVSVCNDDICEYVINGEDDQSEMIIETNIVNETYTPIETNIVNETYTPIETNIVNETNVANETNVVNETNTPIETNVAIDNPIVNGNNKNITSIIQQTSQKSKSKRNKTKKNKNKKKN